MEPVERSAILEWAKKQKDQGFGVVVCNSEFELLLAAQFRANNRYTSRAFTPVRIIYNWSLWKFSNYYPHHLKGVKPILKTRANRNRERLLVIPCIFPLPGTEGPVFWWSVWKEIKS